MGCVLMRSYGVVAAVTGVYVPGAQLRGGGPRVSPG